MTAWINWRYMKKELKTEYIMFQNMKKPINEKISLAMSCLDEAADLLDLGGFDKEANAITEFMVKIASDVK